MPPTLASIPLEYFVAGARLLAAQPEVDRAHIAVWGASRGSEAAALLAAQLPDVIHGAVLSSPSSVVNPGFPDPRRPAWTLHGAALPSITPDEYPAADPPDAPRAFLPVEKITGPVVTICGGQDTVWPSCDYSAVIARRVGAGRVTALSYPNAGHAPVEFGAELAAGRFVAALPGGTPATDIATERDALAAIVRVLDT